MSAGETVKVAVGPEYRGWKPCSGPWSPLHPARRSGCPSHNVFCSQIGHSHSCVAARRPLLRVPIVVGSARPRPRQRRLDLRSECLPGAGHLRLREPPGRLSKTSQEPPARRQARRCSTMQMKPAAISPKSKSLILQFRARPHGNDTFAIDTETNVLIMCPFLIAKQFIIGWPAWYQDTHAAHSLVRPNESTRGPDQLFLAVLVILVRVPRDDVHITHPFQQLEPRLDRPAVFTGSQPWRPGKRRRIEWIARSSAHTARGSPPDHWP